MSNTRKLVNLFCEKGIEFDFESDWTPFFVKNYDLIETALKQVDITVGEKNKANLRPALKDVFAAFNTSYKDTKVVFVGEDPYPEAENAIGYSFLYGSNKIPGSARNIKKSLDNYMGEEYDISDSDFKYFFDDFGHSDFLMLNSAFTIEVINEKDPSEVRKAKEGKHFDIWEPFFNKVVEHLEQKEDVLFVTMGNPAINCTPNVRNVIRCSHPCGMSCYQDLKSGYPSFFKADIWGRIDLFLGDKFGLSIKETIKDYYKNKEEKETSRKR